MDSCNDANVSEMLSMQFTSSNHEVMVENCFNVMHNPIMPENACLAYTSPMKIVGKLTNAFPIHTAV